MNYQQNEMNEWNGFRKCAVCISSFSLHQYVTLRTQYSELTTLTSQYIKFIMDSQRRLEDEEVRDSGSRILNKLNSNIDLNQPTYHSATKWSLCGVNARVTSASRNTSAKMQVHFYSAHHCDEQTMNEFHF